MARIHRICPDVAGDELVSIFLKLTKLHDSLRSILLIAVITVINKYFNLIIVNCFSKIITFEFGSFEIYIKNVRLQSSDYIKQYSDKISLLL